MRSGRRYGQIGLVVLESLLLNGCIGSPLLDHRDAQADPGYLALESAACPLNFGKSEYCASVQWEETPSGEQEGKFLLRFWKYPEANEAGPYSDPPFTLKVKLWMPEMGHGSSPVELGPLQDSGHAAVPGVFEVRHVFFPMPGRWEIWVYAFKGTEIIEKAKLDYQY